MDNLRYMYLLKLVTNVINKKTRWIDTFSVQTITQGHVERHFPHCPDNYWSRTLTTTANF